MCSLCHQRNQLPPHYSEINPNQLPPELMYDFLTMEYVLNKPVAPPPVFLYVVDTCLDEDELKSLKNSLIVSLNLLPRNALVGLVTFGTMALVHELGVSEFPKAYVFKGSKEYTGKQIQEMLGLANGPRPAAPASQTQHQPQQTNAGYARFLQPVAQCEFSLTSILEQLQRNPWPVANDARPLRCTGTAISVAVGLIEATHISAACRVMIFCGGATTEGPGLVASNLLRDAIRSHHDLVRDVAKYWKKAQKVVFLTQFYDGLAKRCTERGIVVDLFAGCGDQVGIMEMKSLVNNTNGNIVLSDSFSMTIFKQSFTRMLKKDESGFLKMGFNATLEVQTSKELKVCGLIGPAISAGKKGANVGETEIGISGTSAWKFCGISPSTTCAIYFEVAPQANFQSQWGVIQFTTLYQHSSGQFRLRVTTIPRKWCEPSSPEIPQSFDQEAAAVLMARIAAFKAEVDDGPDVLRWLDRMLIRTVFLPNTVSKIWSLSKR
jgi:protein transport protein SEC23